MMVDWTTGGSEFGGNDIGLESYTHPTLDIPMAVIYATLIVKGKKTINDVPPVIREQVKQILIDLDLPELAE